MLLIKIGFICGLTAARTTEAASTAGFRTFRARAETGSVGRLSGHRASAPSSLHRLAHVTQPFCALSLFTDPSLPAEYDSAATEMLWDRVLALLDGLNAQPSGSANTAATE